MARKKRKLSDPPSEWFDLLEKHAAGVRRLQMLWRRGRGTYRPLVPFGIDLADLEARPDSEWDRLELPQTHFEWRVDRVEEGDPQARILEVVDELWAIAVEWSRESGKWCDFQLVAYDADGDVLFEDGCRCWLNPPARRSSSTSPSSRLADHDEGAKRSPVTVGVDYRALDDLEGRKDRFIDRLSSDRNWSFQTAQEAMSSAHQAMSAAPTVLGQVGDILERTITYQQGVVEELRNRSTDSVEAQIHSVTEQELTHRKKIQADLWKHLFNNAMSSMVPFASGLASLLANRKVDMCPQFERAQEAMLYLRYSLTQSRLFKICDGSEKAAGSMLAMLEDGAKFKTERDALYYISDVIDLIRTDDFELAATVEEQLAARYLIGRFALYKAADMPEPEPMNSR